MLTIYGDFNCPFSALSSARADASVRTLERPPSPAGGRPFEALPRPITPTLVLPDGYVSRGLGALVRRADLGTAVATS